jgi:ADP-heptose:LPS heptosyltransferase
MSEVIRKVIQIDGGIGRVICATAAIKRMADYGLKPIVIASHPEALWNNPHIHKLYGFNREYMWDDVIKRGDFVHPEPYHERLYYTQKEHLIHTFDRLINGNIGVPLKPLIFLTKEEETEAFNFIQHVKTQGDKKVAIAFQPFGSTAITAVDGVTDATNRSMTISGIKHLANSLSDYALVNLSHIPIDLPNVFNSQLNLRQYIAAVKACDAVFAVDSCVSHIGAAFDKKGVLAMGGTYPENLGYPDYTILMKDEYPKTYFPNRFNGFVDENQGAMDYTNEELDEAIAALRACIPASEVSSLVVPCSCGRCSCDKAN